MPTGCLGHPVGATGTGKTTIARLVAQASSKTFVPLSAVTATVKDIREVAAEAQHRLGAQGQGTILFLDEIHRFTKAQQDALLPSVETGLLVLIGATTENPYFEVNPPLLSRSTLFDCTAWTPTACGRSPSGAWLPRTPGPTRTRSSTWSSGRVATGGTCSPASRSPWPGGVALRGGCGPPRPHAPDPGRRRGALGASPVRYGRDDHYDVVSAFIKSIRGSDVDAALHWLARMLAAGEDARFIARRLVISASEDIGMADPFALMVANAAASAVEFVGLPEARINLAQATVHLALAPKSNTAYAALGRAEADVRSRAVGEVPAHLRDASYRGAEQLGHGSGYRYPHDHPGGWVDQQYLPDELVDVRYYQPGDQVPRLGWSAVGGSGGVGSRHRAAPSATMGPDGRTRAAHRRGRRAGARPVCDRRSRRGASGPCRPCARGGHGRVRRHALPAIDELRAAAADAADQVDRVDALVEVAGAIGDRVDTATEATYRALTSPVIKGVALASGTRRAAQRLRGGDDRRPRTPTGARR